MSDLIRIFKPYAHYYHIIGSALEVNVVNLMTSPIAADQKVMLVFQRWIASDNEVTWEKILEVCQDYPDKFGKAETELRKFLSTERARLTYLEQQG